MSEEQAPEETPETDPATSLEDPPEETPEWIPPTQEAWTKLQEKAARREKVLRDRQAEIAALKAASAPPEGTPPADDKEAKANRKLIAGAARVELASMGVGKEHHAAILEVLNLDGIPVDDDGEVDSDEVAERIERLRTAFGGVAKTPPNPRPRTPRTDTRDQTGAAGAPANPDRARFQRILSRGR